MRILALLVALSAAAAALPPISVRVTPRLALPPLDRVHIEAIIPRDKGNRAVCLVLEGPGLSSASCIPIDGDEAPVVYVRDVWSLKAEGEYTITAELYRQKTGPDKPFSVARATVYVGVQSASAPE